MTSTKQSSAEALTPTDLGPSNPDKEEASSSTSQTETEEEEEEEFQGRKTTVTGEGMTEAFRETLKDGLKRRLSFLSDQHANQDDLDKLENIHFSEYAIDHAILVEMMSPVAFIPRPLTDTQLPPSFLSGSRSQSHKPRTEFVPWKYAGFKSRRDRHKTTNTEKAEDWIPLGEDIQHAMKAYTRFATKWDRETWERSQAVLRSSAGAGSSLYSAQTSTSTSTALQGQTIRVDSGITATPPTRTSSTLSHVSETSTASVASTAAVNSPPIPSLAFSAIAPKGPGGAASGASAMASSAKTTGSASTASSQKEASGKKPKKAMMKGKGKNPAVAVDHGTSNTSPSFTAGLGLSMSPSTSPITAVFDKTDVIIGHPNQAQGQRPRSRSRPRPTFDYTDSHAFAREYMVLHTHISELENDFFAMDAITRRRTTEIQREIRKLERMTESQIQMGIPVPFGRPPRDLMKEREDKRLQATNRAARLKVRARDRAGGEGDGTEGEEKEEEEDEEQEPLPNIPGNKYDLAMWSTSRQWPPRDAVNATYVYSDPEVGDTTWPARHSGLRLPLPSSIDGKSAPTLRRIWRSASASMGGGPGFGAGVWMEPLSFSIIEDGEDDGTGYGFGRGWRGGVRSESDSMESELESRTSGLRMGSQTRNQDFNDPSEDKEYGATLRLTGFRRAQSDMGTMERGRSDRWVQAWREQNRRMAAPRLVQRRVVRPAGGQGIGKRPAPPPAAAPASGPSTAGPSSQVASGAASTASGPAVGK